MKKIFFVGACMLALFLIPNNTAKASEEFFPYTEPSIKNSYCGVGIDFKYCKCAFHGQYCDSIGMDSGSANNIVQSGYTKWVNSNRTSVQNTCQRNGGLWVNKNGAIGCLHCYEPHYPVGNECKHINDLCSDDPNIDYNRETGQCFCPAGFEMTSEKTCESMCGEDPNIFFSTEENDCACVPGYELKTNEDDEYVCEEIPELVLNIEEITEGSKMPYMADGETTGKFKINAIYADTESPAELRFEIKYSTTGKPGTITNVEGDPGEYTVTYQTADLSETDIQSGKDVLYMFYYSKKLDQELYKTFDINLVNTEAVMVKVSKIGFTGQEVKVYFAGDKAQINIYTLDQSGNKIPVNDAAIDYEEYFSARTNKDGKANLEAPTEMEELGAELPPVEVVLELTPEVKKHMADAQEQYTDIIANYALVNPNIKEFVYNFGSYLAKQGSEEKSKKAVAGIKQSKYVLFYIKQGLSLGKDSSDALAEAMGNAVWDLADLLSVFDSFKNPIKDWLNKKSGGLNIEISDKVSQTFKFDLANKLSEVYEKGQHGVIRSFINNIRVAAVRATIGTNKFSPNWLDRTLKEAIDGALQYGINKSGDAASIKTFVADELQDLNQEMADDLLTSLEGTINNNSFNEYGDGYLEGARNSYIEFSDWYLQKHDLEYNATMVKQWTELGFNIAGKAAKILYPATAGEIVDWMETVYKGIRSGVINNVQLATWIRAYTRNQDMMYKHVKMIIPVALAPQDPSYRPFAEVTFAGEEVDILQNLYISDIDPGSEDFEHAVQYVEAQTDVEFYSSLAELTNLLVQIEPENTDLIALNDRIAQEKQMAQTSYDANKIRVEELGLDDPNYGNELSAWDWIIGLGIMGAVIYAVWRLLKFIVRKIRGKKK
ncbi:MAG: hypothetical protein GF349_01370 [Candidatus Magasanikbacteria bacterium]|nr:hypothetical protein [Candidatus Magasanikbacteria bacterium]